MRFNETGTIRLSEYPKTFVYFLINDDEVVYVGQTNNGIIRPLSHRDKDYDRIEMLVCTEQELDLIENKYIVKYSPKYNKELNYSISYSLLRARDEIRKNTRNKEYTKRDLRRDLEELGIEIKKQPHNQKEYVNVNEVKALVDFLNGGELIE